MSRRARLALKAGTWGLSLAPLAALGWWIATDDLTANPISYITGADSAEMGQGGIRVNMVPRDGGNTFRGQGFANFTGSGWGSDNCGSPGILQACSRSNLSGSKTFSSQLTIVMIRAPSNAVPNPSTWN